MKHLKLSALALAAALSLQPQFALAMPAGGVPVSRQRAAAGADFVSVAELFNNAYTAYADGKLATDAGSRSEKYADAIGNISRAAAAAPDDADVLLLASQIYRAKGGTSYARDYFSRAEKALLSRIAKNPNDAGARLDYAIACFAGDPRFGNDYAAYREKAKKSADDALRTLKRVKSKNGVELRVMALAHLVRGNPDECEKLLAAAAEKEPVSKHYLELYNDTVAKGEWLWRVGRESVAKEFLLYTMTDTMRYSGM